MQKILNENFFIFLTKDTGIIIIRTIFITKFLLLKNILLLMTRIATDPSFTITSDPVRSPLKKARQCPGIGHMRIWIRIDFFQVFEDVVRRGTILNRSRRGIVWTLDVQVYKQGL